jgi:hypothetical protein
MYFLPKGQKPGGRWNMSKVVRHLHLAFKGMETEEVYDVLIMHLMSAINGYDPHYKRKVKVIAEAINNELSKRKQFTAADVNRHVDFDSNKYLRLLGRVGFFRPLKKAGPRRRIVRRASMLENSKRLVKKSLLSENSHVSCQTAVPGNLTRRQHDATETFCSA